VPKSSQRVIDIGEWTAQRRHEPDLTHLMPFAPPEASPETVGLEREEVRFVEYYLKLADSLLNAADERAAKAKAR